MGKGLELVSGFVTAPSATFTGWTVATGNSLTIRSANVSAPVALLAAWAQNQVAGVLRVRSPRLHDNVQGIRMRVPAALTLPMFPSMLPGVFAQRLIPQDTLVVEQTGSAVGGQIENGSLLVYYSDLPGIAARLTDIATVKKFGQNMLGQEIPVTTGVAGGYSGQVAINVSFDNFKANTDYALLGGMTDTRKGSVRIQGVDTGNLGVGFPAEPTIRDETSHWFANLSDIYGLPLIPVLNSANKNAILIDATDSQVGGAFVVTLFLVELSAGAVPGATQS
jgi:hypothetical protein